MGLAEGGGPGGETEGVTGSSPSPALPAGISSGLKGPKGASLFRGPWHAGSPVWGTGSQGPQEGLSEADKAQGDRMGQDACTAFGGAVKGWLQLPGGPTKPPPPPPRRLLALKSRGRGNACPGGASLG